MLSIQYILSLFTNTKAIQIIYFIMGAAIIQIVDLFLTIYLTHLFGEYLIMALICCVSLSGLFFSFMRVRAATEAISEDCASSIFPEGRFFELVGIFLAALLIFIPGFISSTTGFMLMFPPLSRKTGRIISKHTSTDWHTVYEYMKI